MRQFLEIVQDLHEISENQTENLHEAFVLVRETMSGLLDTISEKVSSLMTARDMKEASVLLDLASELTELEKDISTKISTFDALLRDKDNSDNGKASASDTEMFLQMNGVPKSLRDPFTFTSPCGMKLTKSIAFQAKNWRVLFMRFCEALYDMNSQLFESFSAMPEMNGTRCPHFSTSSSGFRSIGSIHGKMYVETNMSANGFRDLMMKCMKIYELPINDALIYIKKPKAK